MGCVFFVNVFQSAQRRGRCHVSRSLVKKNPTKTKSQKTSKEKKEKPGREGDALVSDADIRLF